MNQKRISRRNFLQLATVGLTGSLLAACTSNATEAPEQVEEEPQEEPQEAPPTPEPVTVTVWGWWADRMKFFQESGDKFSAKYPYITVEVSSVDQDLWTKVFAAVPAGTGPTLCKMQTTNYFKMRDEEMLLELNDITFPHQYLEETFPNHPWDAYGYYVAPEGNQGALMLYNKAMFTEAGLDPDNPPKTWGEFNEAAKKLTKTDSSGLMTVEGYAYDDWLPNLNLLFQQNQMVVTREGETLKSNFNTPEMGKTFQWFSDAAFVHKFWDKNFPYCSEAVGTGVAATVIGEAWLKGEIEASYPDVGAVLGYAAPPTPDGTANPYYGRQNSVLGLAGLINRPENETEAGQMFLEFLYKEDVESQFKLSDISGLVPAHVQNLARDEVVNDPFYKLMVELVSKEYDIGEIAGPFSDLFYTTMDMLIVNQDTIDTILQFGQDELQKMIDNGDVKYLR